VRALIIEKRVQNLNRLTTCSSYIDNSGKVAVAVAVGGTAGVTVGVVVVGDAGSLVVY